MKYYIYARSYDEFVDLFNLRSKRTKHFYMTKIDDKDVELTFFTPVCQEIKYLFKDVLNFQSHTNIKRKELLNLLKFIDEYSTMSFKRVCDNLTDWTIKR